MDLNEFLTKINKYYNRPNNYLEIEAEITKYCKKTFGLNYNYENLFDILTQTVKFYPKITDFVNIRSTENVDPDTSNTQEVTCSACNGKGGRMFLKDYPNGLDQPGRFLYYGRYDCNKKYEFLTYEFKKLCDQCHGKGRVKVEVDRPYSIHEL